MFFEEDNKIVSYELNLNKEELKKLRKEIIEKCSYKEQIKKDKVYYKFLPNENDETIQYLKKEYAGT